MSTEEILSGVSLLFMTTQFTFFGQLLHFCLLIISQTGGHSHWADRIWRWWYIVEVHSIDYSYPGWGGEKLAHCTQWEICYGLFCHSNNLSIHINNSKPLHIVSSKPQPGTNKLWMECKQFGRWRRLVGTTVFYALMQLQQHYIYQTHIKHIFPIPL